MNETELQFFKQNLLEQKSAILNKTHEFLQEQSQEKTNLADEAEAVSQDISMNLTIHLHERDRLTLYQIEFALSKITKGTYGICESCSEKIGQKRLQIAPFTTLCIECKEDQESFH